ncbi:TPA: 30S ribosomal protein S4e [Candidatus Woesearchaeota archaeon]|nr:30S ribosomal protein S4e [Candidatus Woesearchaeota archaeon]
MVKRHLKTIAAPKTWNIDRKKNVYITRPNPGPHNMRYSLPLSLAMRELFKVAKTAKEAKQILRIKDVFVDRKKRVEEKHPVGLMDVIEFPQLEEQYRVLLDVKGRLTAVAIDKKESSVKHARIVGKTKTKSGRLQLSTNDGRNILVDKDGFKVGDSLELSLPEQAIKGHLSLEKGASILLIGGSHMGSLGKVEDIMGNKILVKSAKNEKFETLKKYAFVIGKDKPVYDCFKEVTKR